MRPDLLARFMRRLIELHSYEVPEMLALAPSAGSAAYLEWLLDSTAEKPMRTEPRAARGRSARGGR